jgi:chromosome segregation ATPase
MDIKERSRKNMSIIETASAASRTETSKQLLAETKLKEQYLHDLRKTQAELASAQSKIKLMKSAHDDLQAADDRNKKRLLELEEQNENYAQMIEALSLDKELAEGTVDDLKDELEMVMEQNANFQAEVKRLENEAESSAAKIIATLPTDQAEVAEMSRMNEDLKSKLRQLHDLAMTERKRFESASVHHKDAVAKLQEELTELRNVKAAHENLIADTEELKAQVEAAQSSQEMAEELTEKNLELGEQLTDLKDEIKQLEQLNQASEDCVAEMQEYVDTVQKELDDKQEEVIEMREEMRNLRVKNADLSKTLQQFRHLKSDLESQIKQLQAGVTASGDSASGAPAGQTQDIIDRFFKMQSQVTSYRTQAVTNGLGSVEAEQATQELEFLKLYIPQNLAVDRDSLVFVRLLHRLRSKSELAMHLLIQYYGPDAVVVSGTADDGVQLADYACSGVQIFLDLVAEVTTLLRCARHTDDTNHRAAITRAKPLHTIDATLDAFIEMVASDSLSEATKLDAIHESLDTCRKFIKTHYGADSLRPLPCAIDGETLAMSLRRITYEQQRSRLQIRSLTNYMASFEEKDIAAFKYEFAKIEDAQITTSAVLSNLLEQAKFMGKLYKPLPQVEEALREADKLSRQCAPKLLELAKAVRGAMDRTHTDQAEVLSALLAPEMQGANSLFHIINHVNKGLNSLVRVLEERVETAKKIIDAGADAENAAVGHATAPWERHATTVREELKEAASLKLQLQNATESLEEKERNLYSANKKVRDQQTILDTLKTRLRLVEEKAGGTSVLQNNVVQLNQKLEEADEEIKLLNDDADKHKKLISKLRAKIKALEINKPSQQRAGFGGSGDLQVEATRAELSLLGSTVRTLRQQLSEARVRSLPVSALAPLPSVKNRMYPAGHYSVYNELVDMSKVSRHAHARQTRRVDKFQAEYATMQSKVNSLRAKPVLVDLTSGAKPSMQFREYEAEYAHQLASAAKLAQDVNRFASKNENRQNPVRLGTVSSNSKSPVGRIVLPAQYSSTTKLDVDDDTIRHLQHLFVSG